MLSSADLRLGSPCSGCGCGVAGAVVLLLGGAVALLVRGHHVLLERLHARQAARTLGRGVTIGFCDLLLFATVSPNSNLIETVTVTIKF